MDKVDQSALRHACRTLLKPIVSFLLKCGMTYREFGEIAKSTFVEVATDEYGIGGRPTNISRVSILTGISRKEVKRQRKLLDETEVAPTSRTTDATRVLSGWHQDPEFLDADGEPLPLALAGDGATLTALCARYGGDVAATTMVKELVRVGAVEEDVDGRLRAKRRYYMPTPFDPQWIMNAGSIFADLGDNINHNLVAGGTDNPSRFLGRATDDTIAASAVPEFREFIEENGGPFLERVDDWLTKRRVDEAEKGSANDRRVRLGLGLFLIQGEPLQGRDNK